MSKEIFHIGSHPISQEVLQKVLQNHLELRLEESTRSLISDSQSWMLAYMEKADHPIYGINTGFGSLCDVRIDDEKLIQLQENLLMSHACGTGNALPEDLCRLMLFLKIMSLSKGHSGISTELMDALIGLYNSGITPLVYEQGSLGASGDLAPLAHLALPLLGKGEVYVQGKISQAEYHNLPLHHLRPKEGLALINGTQFMSALGCYVLLKAEKLLDMADLIAALSLEGFNGLPAPFLPHSHNIRPHPGQQKTAARILQAIEGSELIYSTKPYVQDPYSFRCIPQVHGASRDVIRFAREIFDIEINAVTDNPNIFPEEEMILSAGNFHGQPLALQLDFMAIALSELGSISERRIYKLMEGQRGLPSFLVTNSGLNSGFMIAQYTAASIASQNKQYCTPASADSLVSSNGQEDHVSMGANAATKCLKVLDNTLQILAIEAMAAAQALEFRRPMKAGAEVEALHLEIRKQVPFLTRDEYMHPHLRQMKIWLESRV